MVEVIRDHDEREKKFLFEITVTKRKGIEILLLLCYISLFFATPFT